MQSRIPLTKKQQNVLNFVLRHIANTGYSPSLREVAKFLETDNLSTAQYFIQEIEKKGYLNKKSNVARGITAVLKPHQVQLLGFIAAGEPIEPIENPESILVPPTVPLDDRFPHYALRIKGDSMEDMGICDNDIVIIRHQLTANPGDTVVAVTENGATLKVLRNAHGKLYLEPKNKKYDNIHPTQLEVRGKFIGLLRGE